MTYEQEMTLRSQITIKKQLLQKYKEDVEQVELFAMQRDDYKQKKEMCKNISLKLYYLLYQ